ncbi:MAG TPA: NAD(P)H-dependent oxidoreductase [Oculatellaceae cyanobacterium]
MTRYFFVIAHPEPQSFNYALCNGAVEHLRAGGHDIRQTDLYGEQWQPVSDRRNFTTVHNAAYFKQQLEEAHATEHGGFSADIAAEMEKLFWCDVLVLQFPLWWFSMPAIMKGWVDRVFAFKAIYSREKWYGTGSFKGKKAVLSITTGGPEDHYSREGFHPPLETLLLPIHHGILKFNGFEVCQPFIAREVAHISQFQRETYIAAFQQKLEALSKEPQGCGNNHCLQ